MKFICDYCGKLFCKSATRTRNFKRHFCDKDCYHNFRREHMYEYPGFIRDGSMQNKLKLFAEIRRHMK